MRQKKQVFYVQTLTKPFCLSCIRAHFLPEAYQRIAVFLFSMISIRPCVPPFLRLNDIITVRVCVHIKAKKGEQK